MTRIGVVGLGKMGISHLSILGAHPQVEIAGICDASSYVLSVLGKYTGFPTYDSASAMIAHADLDGLVIATPTRLHAPLVREAADAGVHVFCEKPFCLDAQEATELAGLFARRGLVGQVGYHNRYVAAFREVKRLIDAGALGRVTHVLAEAYGPVVLKPKGSTWRSQKSQGGGALYDYAAHPINLLNWYFGETVDVRGAVLESVFSAETDDAVYAGLAFPGGVSGQLSVNWSDESQRKMTTKITVWGTTGRVYADRQEIQAYLWKDATLLDGYRPGWNVRYTTELTPPVDFYLRGEEYSAQLDAWVRRIAAQEVEGDNDFASAAMTDRAIATLLADAAGERDVRAGWGGSGADGPLLPRQPRFRRRAAERTARWRERARAQWQARRTTRRNAR